MFIIDRFKKTQTLAAVLIFMCCFELILSNDNVTETPKVETTTIEPKVEKTTGATTSGVLDGSK